jgi:CheY-like chemotaxis protein
MYNILICDDDPDIVRALKIYLSDPQYALFEANNGAEALAVCGATDIQLILMDIMMPEMDGISAMVQDPRASPMCRSSC